MQNGNGSLYIPHALDKWSRLVDFVIEFKYAILFDGRKSEFYLLLIRIEDVSFSDTRGCMKIILFQLEYGSIGPDGSCLDVEEDVAAVYGDFNGRVSVDVLKQQGSLNNASLRSVSIAR